MPIAVLTRRSMLVRAAQLGSLAAVAAIGPVTRSALAAPSAASLAPTGPLAFRVMRKGDQIGHQDIAFERMGDRLVVRSQIDIALTLLGLSVFRFHHTVEEIWQGDRLVELTSTTDDDGTPRHVHALSDGAGLKIEAGGASIEGPADLMPSSMWNPETVTRTEVLDSVEGDLGKIAVVDRGTQTIRVRRAEMPTHHYAVTGEVNRELWFGPDRTIVQFRFAGKDGSIVTFELI